MRRQKTVVEERSEAGANSSMAVVPHRIPHAAKVAATWETVWATPEKDRIPDTWGMNGYITAPVVQSIPEKNLLTWIQTRQNSFGNRLITAIRDLRRRDLSGKPDLQLRAEMLEVAWDVWHPFGEGMRNVEDYTTMMDTLEEGFQNEDWGSLMGFDMRLLHRSREAAEHTGIYGLPPGDLGIYEHPLPELGDLVCLRHPWVWRRRPALFPDTVDQNDWGWLVLGSLDKTTYELRLAFDALLADTELPNKDVILPALGIISGMLYGEKNVFERDPTSPDPWVSLLRKNIVISRDTVFTVRADADRRNRRFARARPGEPEPVHLNRNGAGFIYPSETSCPAGSDVVALDDVLLLMDTNDNVLEILQGHQDPKEAMPRHLSRDVPVGVIAKARVPHVLWTTYRRAPDYVGPETWYDEFEPFIYGKLQYIHFSDDLTIGTRERGFGTRTGVPVVWSDTGNLYDEDSGYHYRIAREGQIEPDPSLAGADPPRDVALWRYEKRLGWVKHPYEHLYGNPDDGGRLVGVMHTPSGDVPILGDFRSGETPDFYEANPRQDFFLFDGAYKLNITVSRRREDGGPIWRLIRWEIIQDGPNSPQEVEVPRATLRELLPADVALPRGETFLVWNNATLSDPETNQMVPGFAKPHPALRDVLPFLLPLPSGLPLARAFPPNPKAHAVKPTTDSADHIASFGSRDVAAVDQYDGMALYQRLLDLVRTGELKPGQPSQCRLYRRGHQD